MEHTEQEGVEIESEVINAVYTAMCKRQEFRTTALVPQEHGRQTNRAVGYFMCEGRICEVKITAYTYVGRTMKNGKLLADGSLDLSRDLGKIILRISYFVGGLRMRQVSTTVQRHLVDKGKYLDNILKAAERWCSNGRYQRIRLERETIKELRGTSFYRNMAATSYSWNCWRKDNGYVGEKRHDIVFTDVAKSLWEAMTKARMEYYEEMRLLMRSVG